MSTKCHTINDEPHVQYVNQVQQNKEKITPDSQSARLDIKTAINDGTIFTNIDDEGLMV